MDAGARATLEQLPRRAVYSRTASWSGAILGQPPEATQEHLPRVPTQGVRNT